MIELAAFYKSTASIESFLIGAITLFVGASIILYVLIVKSRNNNIRRERLRQEYSTFIEKLMFLIVFQETSYADIKEDKEYIELEKITFFKEVLTESILDLHKNYDGIYAQKLEQFYKDSGLIKESYKKLRSLKWEQNCKGIIELAEMNIIEALDAIIKLTTARNKTLKIIAINALIKLAGVKGIIHLVEHAYPIDSWTQVNIISAFKKHDIHDIKGVELLLESKNSTVVTLGLKLIKELKLTQKIPYVKQLVISNSRVEVQKEAQNVLQVLTVLE